MISRGAPRTQTDSIMHPSSHNGSVAIRICWPPQHAPHPHPNSFHLIAFSVWKNTRFDDFSVTMCLCIHVINYPSNFFQSIHACLRVWKPFLSPDSSNGKILDFVVSCNCYFSPTTFRRQLFFDADEKLRIQLTARCHSFHKLGQIVRLTHTSFKSRSSNAG